MGSRKSGDQSKRVLEIVCRQGRWVVFSKEKGHFSQTAERLEVAIFRDAALQDMRKIAPGLLVSLIGGLL